MRARIADFPDHELRRMPQQLGPQGRVNVLGVGPGGQRADTGGLPSSRLEDGAVAPTAAARTDRGGPAPLSGAPSVQIEEGILLEDFQRIDHLTAQSKHLQGLLERV
jgi:hypothetical protein